MTSGGLPTEIDPDDLLGRGVFSSKHEKEFQSGVCPHHVFLLSEGARISVDRLIVGREQELEIIGDNNALRRGENRSFYGWAVVTAQEVVEKGAKRGRRVDPSPTRENLFHADIVLPENDALDRKQKKAHAFDLAREAKWRSRP